MLFNTHGFRLKEERGFDAVISNPPYVDIKGLDKDLTKYLFTAYDTTRLRINVFASFLEQALKTASEQSGRIGFIIPTAFLTQESCAPVRKVILGKYWLRSVVRLPNKLFGQAAGDVKVDTCIVIVHPRSSPSDFITDVLIYESFERTNTTSHATASAAFKMSQQKWMNRNSSAITLFEEKEDKTFERMRIQSASLEEYCEFCLGLTPYDKYTGHTEEQIRNKVFHAKSQIDPTYKKLLVSGDVRRYEVEWNGEKWIKYGEWLAAPREQRFFTQERILVQQIIDWSSLRLFAGWTDEELYNTQNQFNLLPRKGTNLKFILAILNSRLMSYYHRKVFLDVALQRFQKVLIKDAKTFPIRRIAFITPRDERAQRMNEVKPLYEHCLSQGDSDSTVAFVDHELTQTPERANVVHDLLAFLAEQMITMNKQKQTEVKGFITWLEHGIGAAVDDLNNKTKVKVYHEFDFETLLAVLKQNRRKLTVNPDSRTVQDAIEREYNASIAKLTPLNAKIAATNRLIDLIVYRLYGLTEEEIAIVEGHASGNTETMGAEQQPVIS